ncbi:hypothetical protein [Vogesella sp. LIG4]|uniref:hypothetical protein n=1 Tax=Vogesella sp. LIG4 TaxID=1192162 RepID=UPI00081FC13D|nr:hypothetical protein [Vogesella sp. LIG4]SCK27579.1 hypothetical protein PSELUDRAFT_3358 [Vogesella sp. LIG4]
MNDKTRKPAGNKQAEQQRFAQAEAACGQTLALFATLAEDPAWQACELAGKYAQMAAVYARRIRNGRVLCAADFNAAVEVCTSARRALRALDAELQFAGHPQAAALQQAAQGCYQVLAAHHQLTGGKRQG